MAQLSINLTGIVLAGVGTLYLERWLYKRRKRDHRDDDSRIAAGLPGAQAGARPQR